MSTKTIFLFAALAITASAVPGAASARVYLDVEVAPPAARVEVVPAARRGYTWAPGYYNWSGHQHVWVGGRYIRQRSGNHWSADRWEQRGTHWHHEPGRWDHD